jgi:hypothetical protein
MADDGRFDDAGQERDGIAGLPRHLAALVGALNGPADLGRNHDKYLSYPDRDEASGAASA